MIKAVVNENKKAAKFPKLMVSNHGEVVLFLREKVGTSVTGVLTQKGHFSETWIMGRFQDFHGTITLSNEE